MNRINRNRSLALTCILASLGATVARAQQPAAFRTLVADVSGDVDIQAVSPNGRFIAQSTAKETHLFDLATRRSISLLGIGSDIIDALVWSPASDRIAWTQGASAATNQVWTVSIDAATGAVRGAMQRVTMGNAFNPVFSSDGRSIAYATPSVGAQPEKGPWSSGDLMIVPVAGGPARIVAHIPGMIWPTHWSADNTTIYVDAMTHPKSPGPGVIRSILKVRTDNGVTEVIRPGDEFVMGATPDRRFTIVRGPITAAGYAAIIIDANGKEVERVQLPAGSDGGIGVMGDSALVVEVLDRPHRVLEIHPLAGGAGRRVTLTGESNSTPIWSPDGKQIAFEVTENGHRSLAVMNATGGTAEVFHDSRVGGTPGNRSEPKWSPDSKYIGFSGIDKGSLMMLDVTAHAVRTLLAASSDTVGGWVWRPDGRSIAFVSMNRSVHPRTRIEEIAVSGTRRTLLEDGSPFPGTSGQVGFVGGAGRWGVTDSGLYVVSFDSKIVRRVTDDPATGGLVLPAVSPDLRSLGGGVRANAPGNPVGLAVYSLETGMKRSIEVPATITPAGFATFSPDNKELLFAAYERGDSIAKLMAFPLAGGAPHPVASLGSNAATASYSISPDGKFIVSSVLPYHAQTSSLVLVDLKAILARAALRGSRE